MNLERRQLLALLAAFGLQSLFPGRAGATSASGARLPVIGGGFGGATVARMLKRLLPRARISLIEPNASFTACPLSNLVLSGQRQLSQQVFTYTGLRQEGVEVIADAALQVDPERRQIHLKGGGRLAYDRLVMSPGIDFRWGELAGYDAEAAEKMPHAWQAGPQTLLLRRQLEAMPAGGTLLLCVAAAPFRCPPGPYERASLLADYLQKHKPRARLLILDSNERFSKQPLFLQAWQTLYPDIVEWRGAGDGGRVIRVEADKSLVHTDFASLRGQVVNVVPPQKAGLIAERSGVADASGWCPIDPRTFESLLVPGIHVIGDATLAAPMPKSAFSANMHAKVCALQIARLMTGLPPEPTTLANTCFSQISETEAISISGVYRNDDGRLTQVPGAGGITPLDATPGARQLEAKQAKDWFRAVTREAFGV